MLDQIEAKLAGLVRADVWASGIKKRGEAVRIYREYMDGKHKSGLTAKMQEIMRMSGDELEQINNNYCPLVVAAKADRLAVQSIQATGDAAEAANQWADGILRSNRYDGLQMAVHEAVLVDGDTFVFVDWDNERDMVRLSHERAFDGHTGMMVVYDRMGATIVAAIKVWYEPALGDRRRVNIYRAGGIERYVAATGGSLEPYTGEDGTEESVANWEVGRVPIAHFRNGSRLTDGGRTGQSELAAVKPLQDALNRTLYSVVAMAENTAFQKLVAKGFEPPDTIAPGDVIVIARDEDGKKVPLLADDVADMYALPQGNIDQVLEHAQDLRREIGVVSRTPLPSAMGGSNQSGEALKQREVDLLAALRRLEVVLGNAWEDVMWIAGAVHDTYSGNKAPQVRDWFTRWQDAEVRNDKETIENALAVRELVGLRETLRLIAPVYDWDADKIEELVAGSEAAERERLADAFGGLRGFNPGSRRQIA